MEARWPARPDAQGRWHRRLEALPIQGVRGGRSAAQRHLAVVKRKNVMNEMHCMPTSRVPRNRERGVSLMFALITVAALALAAVALVRSVDTGSLVIGNLGFKQDSLLAADDAARQAIDWLDAHKADTALNGTLEGYSPALIADLDPTNTSKLVTRIVIDWDDDGCA